MRKGHFFWPFLISAVVLQKGGGKKKKKHWGKGQTRAKRIVAVLFYSLH
jgi:hypothetical protein